MSLFQNFDHWIFDENREALNRHYQEHQTKDDPLYVGPRTPVLIISKIARDPSHREFLSAAENPHITMLALYLFNICKQSPYGVIVETRAQPDTQRLLQPRSVRRTFPGYHVIYPPNLYNEVGRLSENPTDPSIMLFHLPHTRNLDLIKGNIPSLVLGTGK
jgi:hypothetical protein